MENNKQENQLDGRDASGVTGQSGTVIGLTADTCVVTTDSVAGCVGCAVSFLCHKDAAGRLSVSRSACEPQALQCGDRVRIEVSSRMAWRAVVFCVVLPLFVLLVATVCVDRFTGNSLCACIAGLAAVVAYYATAYYLRHVIVGKDHLKIVKI